MSKNWINKTWINARQDGKSKYAKLVNEKNLDHIE